MYKYKFRIPPYYTLLVRSLTILEGIALASDPNYKVLGAAYPWVARRLLTDESPELRKTLRKLLYTAEGCFRFERLEALLEQAVRSPPRPSRAGTALRCLFHVVVPSPYPCSICLGGCSSLLSSAVHCRCTRSDRGDGGE